MAKDAIAGYIESLKKHKEPIPTDDETLVRPWSWNTPTRKQSSEFNRRSTLNEVSGMAKLLLFGQR